MCSTRTFWSELVWGTPRDIFISSIFKIQAQPAEPPDERKLAERKPAEVLQTVETDVAGGNAGLFSHSRSD